MLRLIGFEVSVTIKRVVNNPQIINKSMDKLTKLRFLEIWLTQNTTIVHPFDIL